MGSLPVAAQDQTTLHIDLALSKHAHLFWLVTMHEKHFEQQSL